MPTYEFKCSVCGYIEERFGQVSDLDAMKEHSFCCTHPMRKLVSIGGDFFFRSPFDSKDVFEHASETPMRFKSAAHLRDHCEQHGIRSRLIEDGDIR